MPVKDSGRTSPPVNDTEAEILRAAARAEIALEAGLASITTREEALRALEELERAAGSLRESDVQDAVPAHTPRQQAAAVEHAARTSPEADRPAAVIAQVATQLAGAPVEGRSAMDIAIQRATGVMAEGQPGAAAPPEVIRARRLLRREMIRRLRPFDAVDTLVYLQINHLPHPAPVDRLVSRFSWVMTGGAGWLFVLVGATLINPRRGLHAAVGVLPALWLATSTVEYPIKQFVRRRRPFISIIRAIVVGRKPGSYSFPSGHTAAAFAGAALLSHYFPKQKQAFHFVAGLVGLSRIYLGAHYPGDVLSGGAVGTVLARAYHALLFGNRRGR